MWHDSTPPSSRRAASGTGTLTPFVFAVVLAAAVLHASWNALLKSGGDRFRSITAMTAAASLASLPTLAFLPLPRAAAWPAVALSAALHLGYNLALVRSYRHGDLGQVYPLARGSSPLLVLVGAFLTTGEWPHPVAVGGMVLVCGGIVGLARGWGAAARRGVPAALTTGCFIAAYSVTDGVGGRLSGHPLSYAMWLFALDGLPMLALYYVARRNRPALLSADRETAKAVMGGLVSLVAYTGVIWAASVSPMGPVSALRETSVVFAALIGRFALRETLTIWRLACCLGVAVGAVLLAVG